MPTPASSPHFDDTFQVFARLRAFTKASKADGETSMWIGGIASTEDLDQQDEVVVADGLDFSGFLDRGWFNDNHKQGSTDVVGYPTDAFRVKPGDTLPDGSTAESDGWWTEGYLLDTKKGHDLWELVHALEGTPRGLGFSIEGKILNRSKGKVKAAAVQNVAVTHCPVNTKSYMVALAKALTAGSAVASGDINAGPGAGGALRTESLEGSPVQAEESEEERKALADTLRGATAFPEVAAAEGKPIRKAEAEGDNPDAPLPRGPVRVIDEIARWAPAMAEHARDHHDPDKARLTKSEARIVARTLYPRLGPKVRADVIKHLTGGRGHGSQALEDGQAARRHGLQHLPRRLRGQGDGPHGAGRLEGPPRRGRGRGRLRGARR